MTAAEQRELFKQALALPKKARLNLYNRLVKSLEAPKTSDKRVRDSRILAEPAAVYGGTKSPKRANNIPQTAKALSKKEWNRSWRTEIEKRINEIDSGKVKCIPHAEARKRWD
jgi:hypothetical protein